MFHYYPGPGQRPHSYRFHQPYQHPVYSNIPPPNQRGAAGLLGRLLKGQGSAPMNIEGILQNVQRFLSMAEQVTPIIQQYGPLIKNAPALLQILTDSSNEEAEKVSEKQTDTSKANNKQSSGTETAVERKSQNKKKESAPRDSVPKLYV